DIYTRFAIDDGAVPVLPGIKSQAEKFAGAARSYSIEAMMGDTKALQAGTSHNLGQNFAKAFDIRYLDTNNQLQYCWTTSWGVSTRFIGAIIMTHGDDQGLVLPPRLAPIQVVIVPIYKNDEEQSLVMPVVQQISAQLGEFRIKVDDRPEVTPGYKFNDWELRGVPLRLEVGPKDVQKGSVMAARRDIPGKAGKTILSQDNLSAQVGNLLVEIQQAMLQRATEFRDAHISEPKDYGELQQIVQDGWALAWWCGSGECEAKVKEDTKATTRCIPLDQVEGNGRCIVCGEKAAHKVYFAKAY
ncbi:proline--tRNA ligase, partial [bacterium]|nr:proline--tRNA ligase [bacterium]